MNIDLFFNYQRYGKDEFGNIYFISKKNDPVLKKRKRVVKYAGKAEASKIPAVWHGWLHYMFENVTEDMKEKYVWQKSYLPNLTATENCYMPPGHIAKGGIREKVSSDYNFWNSDNNKKNK